MPVSLLDVIIPARGECPWLEDALTSIARQTLPPDGVIVVDDGLEKPGGADVIGTRLFGKRYRRIPNRGQGISDALNTGVACSQAVWVVRMDADDVSHPSRFEQQYHRLSAADSGLLGCGCQVRLIDESGTGLGRSNYPTNRTEIEGRLLRHSCFAHPTLVLRREALLSTPYRSSLDGAEDVDLVLRLSERGRLVNLDVVLLDYRIHVGQANFLRRARQTALQELAFRLAGARASTGRDPLASDPGLAAAFVAWRLQLPGYVQARQAMTALRYLVSFARGGNLAAAAACLRQLAGARPWQQNVRGWIRRVSRDGPGGLAHDTCPFTALNITTTGANGSERHA